MSLSSRNVAQKCWQRIGSSIKKKKEKIIADIIGGSEFGNFFGILWTDPSSARKVQNCSFLNQAGTERPTQRSSERSKTKNFWNIPTLKLGLCLGIDPRGFIPGSQGNSLGFVHPGPAFIWEWVVKSDIFGHKSDIFGHKVCPWIPKLPELLKDTWAGFSSWKVYSSPPNSSAADLGPGRSLDPPNPIIIFGVSRWHFPFPAAISTLSPENGFAWEFHHVPKSQNSPFLSCFEVVFTPVLEQGGIWDGSSWAGLSLLSTGDFLGALPIPWERWKNLDFGVRNPSGMGSDPQDRVQQFHLCFIFDFFSLTKGFFSRGRGGFAWVSWFVCTLDVVVPLSICIYLYL